MIPRLTLIAAVTSLALGGAAHGAILYFPDQNIPIPNTYAGISVDLETGSSSTSINGLAGGDANFFLGGARASNDAEAGATEASWQPIRVGTANTDALRQLAFGSTVDIASTSYSTGFGASGQINPHFGGPSGFTAGTPGYLGYSLVIDNPANPGNPLTVYGWALVTLEDNDGIGTIHSWAYEDTGSAIQVGAIPEPKFLPLVLAAGLIALRRRR